MTVQWKRLLFYLLRFGFGGLLIFSSLGKIINPQDFSFAVENYRIFGAVLSRWVAVWVPYVELFVGILLISGVWLDAAAFVNVILMVVFFLMVTQAYVRGLDIVCGCFTADEGARIGLIKIFENIGFLFTGIVLLWMVLLDGKRIRK